MVHVGYSRRRIPTSLLGSSPCRRKWRDYSPPIDPWCSYRPRRPCQHVLRNPRRSLAGYFSKCGVQEDIFFSVHARITGGPCQTCKPTPGLGQETVVAVHHQHTQRLMDVLVIFWPHDTRRRRAKQRDRHHVLIEPLETEDGANEHPTFLKVDTLYASGCHRRSQYSHALAWPRRPSSLHHSTQQVSEKTISDKRPPSLVYSRNHSPGEWPHHHAMSKESRRHGDQCRTCISPTVDVAVAWTLRSMAN
jgi:hypothetical protein